MAARIVWLFSRLVRVRIVGLEKADICPNAIFAHWHGDELALLPHFGKYGLTIMVSLSKDGERMAQAAASLGYRIIRGSSRRGGASALHSLIKEVKSGKRAVLAVDGPRGPRGVCKPGIVMLSQKTGAPLFPAGVAVSSRYVFQKTWNQVYIPLPFARQVIFFGDPIHFPMERGKCPMESHLCMVENALNNAHDQAENILRHWRSKRADIISANPQLPPSLQ
jgi:lysophospholipid acyltransferase (LPLAT)-like uncharacterized protein